MTKTEERLKQLDAYFKQMGGLEDEIREIKDEKIPKVLKSLKIDDNILNKIYWQYRFVSLDIVGKLLGESVYDLRKRVKPFKARVKCNCGRPYKVVVKSRSQLKDAEKNTNTWRYDNFACPNCIRKWQIEDAEEKKWSDIRWETYEKRLKELRTMDYKEFLKTPEWKKVSGRHKRSVENRCQLCNKEDPKIEIHHRTYDSRGCEGFKDLIALCHDCHTAFHKKLIKT